MNVYLAGQISGLSYTDAYNAFLSRELLIKKYASKIGAIYNPLRCKSYLSGETNLSPDGYNYPNTTPKAILHTDYWHVENCDIFYLDLQDANKFSVGSICELAWAWQLRKHCVVVLPNNDLYNHAFITEMAHVIFETTQDAIRYIAELSDV